MHDCKFIDVFILRKKIYNNELEVKTYFDIGSQSSRKFKYGLGYKFSIVVTHRPELELFSNN